MTDTPIPQAPRRLADEGGDMAGLLRHAEPEFQTRLNESGAWGRIERTRHRRTAISWAISAAGMVAAVALVGFGASRLRADRHELAFT
jgi:hypothetical protein